MVCEGNGRMGAVRTRVSNRDTLFVATKKPAQGGLEPSCGNYSSAANS